jgi:hypothetical protein
VQCVQTAPFSRAPQPRRSLTALSVPCRLTPFPAASPAELPLPGQPASIHAGPQHSQTPPHNSTLNSPPPDPTHPL